MKPHHAKVREVLKKYKEIDANTSLVGTEDWVCVRLDKIYRRRLAELIRKVDPKQASADLNRLRQEVIDL